MIILIVIKTFDYFLDLSTSCLVQKGVPKAQHDVLKSLVFSTMELYSVYCQETRIYRSPEGKEDLFFFYFFFSGALKNVLMCETE